MREMKAANELLADRAALLKRFDDEGYLLFRNVLDPDAVARLREEYLHALSHIGVIDSQAREPIWNGASLENFSARMQGLAAKEPWKRFRDEPQVARWIHALLGEEYLWIPSIAYRVTPPAAVAASDASGASRFRRIHQDGYDNPGLHFLICWVPLMAIDAAVGGIAVAAGCHRRGYLHDTSGPTMFEVAPDAIPDDAWVSTTFEPGDLLVQHPATPHTGLTNHSNRFRLSLDFRVTPKSSGYPVIGHIVAIDRDRISIRTDEQRTVELNIDDATYCPYRRGSALLNRGCIPREDLTTYLTVGQGVLAMPASGTARLIRGFDIGLRA